MDKQTGVIDFAGSPKAQTQLVDGPDGKRTAQLYNTDGVFLCACPFTGDDDAGYTVAQALFNGYLAGWNNCQYALSKAVTRALYGRDGDAAMI